MKLESELQIAAKKGGFTLLEMLMVVAILGIIVSIAIAAVNTAKTDSQATKEKALLASIELAKTRAVLVGNVNTGNMGKHSDFRAFLIIKGREAALSDIVVGTNNGTGKNVTNWGRYNSPADPVVLGTGPAVTQ